MVKPSGKKLKKQKEICHICMETAINCKTVECGHEFCFRCLSKWTRRKGTCPVCRQDVRRVHYKNKVIEPEFLKIFDEEKLLSEELQIRENRYYYMPYLFMGSPQAAQQPSAQFQPVQLPPTPFFFPFYFAPSA